MEKMKEKKVKMFKSIHPDSCRVFHDIEQNTDQWLGFRAKRVAGTTFSTVLSGKKTDGYIDTIKRIAVETLSGEPVETAFYGNKTTQRGHDLEPLALIEYERLMFCEVNRGGFFAFTDFVGVSPDGHYHRGNDFIGVEAKCPEYKKFIEYLLNPEELVNDYYTQVQGEIYGCGFAFVDLFAYYPGYNLVKVRVYPDEKFLFKLENEIELAKEAVNKLIEILKINRIDYKGNK